MDRPDTTATSVRSWTAKEVRPARPAQRRRPSGLTRRQRLLAGATAVAILLSGLNAFVQVCKAVVEYATTGSSRN